MRRSLPGTAALQAFESAAHHGSFTAAARELDVTQGAISRQVQALEQHVGTPLFHRERQRIRLTSSGERYLQHVRAAFDRLEGAELELRALRRGGGVLQLAILPTYGTKWLIPRLPSFAREHPDVQLHFTTRLQPFDFAGADLDAAIHYGDPTWPGARLDELMPEHVAVVCTASYRDALPLREPADLRRATSLQLPTRPHALADWQRAAGGEAVEPRRAVRFEHHEMVLQAAIAGLGVAVLPLFVCERELADGRVVEPFPGTRAATGKRYWLASPEGRAGLPALAAFRSWLLREHGRSVPSPAPVPGHG